MAAHGVRFLADDIWDMPEDGNVYEVIEGALYASPTPPFRHQRALTRLLCVLSPPIFSDDRAEIVSHVGVVLDAETAVVPDVVYLSREKLPLISARGVEGAPDLLVEVLSPSTQARDRGVKMRRYAASGVPHYWLLDLDSPALETYRLGIEGYELTGRHGPGTIFRPELFPGLEIRLDDLWA